MIIKNYKIIPNFEYNSLVKSREQLAKLQHTMSKLSDRFPQYNNGSYR